MLKAYKYRIYPTGHQKMMIDRTFGVCRLVYNLALETKIRAYQSAEVNLSTFDLCYQLPELKEAYPWIGEVNSQSLQAVLKMMDVAFKNFFRGAGYPKFKKKSGRQSFQCPQHVKINSDKSTLTIPKIKDIPIVLSRVFEGTIKTVTISRTPTGKYFASILVDNKIDLPLKPAITAPTTIGIDVGIKSFVVTSNGRSFAPNQYLKKSLARLQVLQRRASKKKKGSHNRKKANLCVAKLHEKITFQRVDYCHKTTTQLIRDNQAESFVIEDLAVVNMLQNRKLSRTISDVGVGEFFRQLQYKCDWYGKNLIVINRFSPSSKRCSECGSINDTLTLADRAWTCGCGAAHDRDLNAAKNIRWFGLQQTIFNHAGAGNPGEPVEPRRLRRTKKQENIPV